MNNYEKIKQMSIDKMAEFLQQITLDGICHYCLGCDTEEEIGCINGIIMWLEDEVNDNERN